MCRGRDEGEDEGESGDGEDGGGMCLGIDNAEIWVETEMKRGCCRICPLPSALLHPTFCRRESTLLPSSPQSLSTTSLPDSQV